MSGFPHIEICLMLVTKFLDVLVKTKKNNATLYIFLSELTTAF